MPPAFRRQLRRIDRKHPGTADAVAGTLEDIANRGVPHKALRIPGLQGAPVYKLRIPLSGAGTLAARLILHYDGKVPTPLFAYTKADTVDIATREIRNALRAAGLEGPGPGTEGG